MALSGRKKLQRRRKAIRNKIREQASGRPRLSVHRSGRHIYAQVIDDLEGRTLVAASTLEQDMRKAGTSGANVNAAQAVGKRIAERAVGAGVTEVVFDRSGYIYHGRIKALADAARDGGLKF